MTSAKTLPAAARPPGRRRWLPVLLALLAGCSEPRYPLPAVRPELQVALCRHVLEHGVPPEEYVIRKFGSRDVVLLGQYGRIRHDVLLVQDVLPRLPDAGVARLGLELAGTGDQTALDGLVTADAWDEDLARAIVKRNDPFRGHRECLDLLRATWSLNRARGGLALRIVPLGGPPDEALAALRAAGALEPGARTLILTGFENAFTRFRLPGTGLGNRIHDALGNRAATVLLHAPWPSVLGSGAPPVYPADGHIDASLIALSDRNRRAGFDVGGSAFARLPLGTCAWSREREGVTLGDLCDGYVVQTALHDSEGVTPIDGWFEDPARQDELRASCDIPREFRRYH